MVESGDTVDGRYVFGTVGSFYPPDNFNSVLEVEDSRVEVG